MIGPSAEEMTGVPQLSVAVTLPAAGTPFGLHPNSRPCGQDVITGGVMSCITTVFEQVVVHAPVPTVSVTEYVVLQLDDERMFTQ